MLVCAGRYLFYQYFMIFIVRIGYFNHQIIFNGKNQLKSFKACQALQFWYRMCLHSRLFKKFKKINIKIDENLKHIFGVNYKLVHRIDHYSFGINHVNVQGYLEVLKFLISNSRNLKHIFGTIKNFNQNLSTINLYILLKTTTLL